MISQEQLRLIEIQIKNTKNIRNIGTAAHIDHGKTTLSDNLVAGAGYISQEAAGEQLFMDSDVQEKARGITINAASVTIRFQYEGENYLINLIDTRGHVDFGGDVTRAMRVLDGVLILVCAIEGIMPQTETVLKQALQEKVKRIMFVNKLDRLIVELLSTQENISKRIQGYISDINKIITSFPGGQQWAVSRKNGTVLFGSAFHKWAISSLSYPITKIGLSEVIKYCMEGKQKELSRVSPLNRIVLQSVIANIPSRIEAQKYRIDNISLEPQDTEMGASLRECNLEGPISFFITKVLAPPGKETICMGRLFSGTLSKKTQLMEAGLKSNRKYNIQKITLAIGAEQVRIKEAPAGMLVGIAGLEDVRRGRTLSSVDQVRFEDFKSYSERVITYSLGISNAQDLPKLISALIEMTRRDRSLETVIDEESKEFLLSGMGELHLEISLYRLKNEYKLDLQVKNRKVLYKEIVEEKGQEIMATSRNKHNRFMLEVDIIRENVLKYLLDERVDEGTLKRVPLELLIEKGLERSKARRILYYYKGNLFIDQTRSAQRMSEVMESMIMGFKTLCNKGRLAGVKMQGLMLLLNDLEIHVDGVHRGPAQIIPAILSSARQSLSLGKVSLYERYQKISLKTISSLNSIILSWIQQKRGELQSVAQITENDIKITFIARISELFGFSSQIRGLTSGRASWEYSLDSYYKMPEYLQTEVIEKLKNEK